MKLSHFTKALSVILNFALVTTSVAAPAPATGPDMLKALTPPSRLGYVDSYYQGSTEHPLLLIQDLHANYGVQKKIYSILEFIQSQTAKNGQSMTLGIEGAWGSVNLDAIRRESESVRKRAGEFLLKNAEISGMEHFAAMSKSPVNVVGIENPEDYIVHQGLFRKSLAARLALAQKVDRLREIVNGTKVSAPRSLLRLWKISDDFHAGRIGLAELSKKLDTPIQNYGDAEIALERAKMAVVSAQPAKDTVSLKNTVQADQDLELLARLLRQQLTLEEVQFVGKRTPEMLSVVESLIPGENMNLWEDTVRAAINHYAAALVRNQPMSQHAFELAQAHPAESVVVVTGGFHTAEIAQFLESKKISYVVIAPIVESHTIKDETLYYQRMMDLHVTDPEIAKAFNVNPRRDALAVTGTYTAKGMNWTTAKASQLWDRILVYIRNDRTPPPSAVAVEGDLKLAKDIVTLAGLQPQVESPGFFARVKFRFLKFFGYQPTVVVARNTTVDKVVDFTPEAGAESADGTTAVTMTKVGKEPEVETQKVYTPAKGSGRVRRWATRATVTFGSIASMFAQSSVGEAAKEAHKTLANNPHAADPSSAWMWAVGALAAVGVGAAVQYKYKNSPAFQQKVNGLVNTFA